MGSYESFVSGQEDLSISRNVETTDNGNDVVVNSTEELKVFGPEDNPFPEGHPNHQQFADAIARENVISINQYYDPVKKKNRVYVS